MSNKIHNPPVFVINLPRSADRRESISQKLAEQGLEFEFIEAVDGKTLPMEDGDHYNRKARLRYFGRDLTAGELGCLMSHRKAYEIMAERNLPSAIVFEDDVIFKHNHFADVVEAILKLERQWDIVRFLGKKKKCRSFEKLTDKHMLVKLPGTPGGGHGYILTQHAAQILLKHTHKPWVPIDTLLGRTWETGLKVFCVEPSPITTNEELTSTIGDTRFDKSRKTPEGASPFYPLFRGWYKLCENIGKTIAYWFD